MGALIYSRETSYEMDDRTLGHVQVAAGAKLQRRDSFYLSWAIPLQSGSGRVSLWLSAGIPLQFAFETAVHPPLNPRWVRALELTAISDHGMVIVPEHEADAYVRRHTLDGVPLDDEFSRH